MRDKKNTPIISVKNLHFAYKGEVVLWNLNIQFPSQKLIGIIGPNGAGKSTLLKNIVGLIKPNQGTITFHARRDKKKSIPDLSYIPQRDNIDVDFPVTVYDIVMMGRYKYLGLFQKPSSQDKKRVTQALEAVGLEKLWNKQLADLSGGQQQRVLLARSIAQDSPILLMDEPLRGLDIATTLKFFEIVQNMVKQGKTVIMVHHYLHSATQFDWLLLINKHKIAEGPTKEVFIKKNLERTYGPQLTAMYEIQHIISNQTLTVPKG